MYAVGLVVRGRQAIAQARTVSELGPRDFVVYSTSRPCRADVDARPGAAASVVVQVPSTDVPPPPDRVGRLLAARLPARDGAGCLLAGLLTQLAADTAPLRPADAHRIGGVLVDLVTAWLAQHTDSEDRTPAETRRQVLFLQVEDFIRRHLGDPGLSPATVAAAHIAAAASPAPAASAVPSPEDEAAAVDLGGRTHEGYGIATADTAAPAPDTAVPSQDRARFADARFGCGSPEATVPLRGATSATVPAGGCVAAARRELGGSLRARARIDYVPQLLADATLHAATGDPGYTAVLAGRQPARAAAATRTPPRRPPPPSCAASTPRARPNPPSAGARSPLRWRTAGCQIRTHLPATLLRLRRQEAARLPVSDLRLLQQVTPEWQSAPARATRVPTPPGPVRAAGRA